jgi:putative DNA primase/helicase
MKLRDMNQWILWKEKLRNGKNTKVPVGLNGKPTSITEPKNFLNFDTVFKASSNQELFSGIGFCLTEDDNIVGIDLDSIDTWNGAKEIVDRMNSYTEWSPSGKGIHILCEGYVTGEKHGIRNGNIEIYDANRFFTITLDVIDDNWQHGDVRQSQEQIDWLVGSLDDKGLMSKILTKDYAEKFKTLWVGEWSKIGYKSQSEGDLAFCRILSNVGAPVHQIDRLLRKSKLMRPKWDEPRGTETYGQKTLDKATTDDRCRLTTKMYGKF